MSKRLPALYQWIRRLPANPIYKRERGDWGNPNPIYSKFAQYSPFIIIASLLLGFCGGFQTPYWQVNEDLFAIYCLICLPSGLMNVLTWYGLVAAPALTAPSIGLEQASGSWEMLLTVLQSRQEIIFAKFFGAMARLKIWRPLLVLGLIQVCAGSILLMVRINQPADLLGLLVLPASILRPILSIFIAGLFGLYLSTWINSPTLTLTATYAGIFTMKFLLWLPSILAIIYFASANFTFVSTLSIVDTLLQIGIIVTLTILIWRRIATIDI